MDKLPNSFWPFYKACYLKGPNLFTCTIAGKLIGKKFDSSGES